MAKKNGDKAPMEHVEVPYPSEEQGSHSLSHLAKAALGAEPVNASELANHGWVVVGAGLGVALPISSPDGMKAAAAKLDLTAEQKAALQDFTAMKAGDDVKADPKRWAAILKVVLPILLQLISGLGCLLVVLGCVGPARAGHRQAPLPPQDMLAAAVADAGDPFAERNAEKPAGKYGVMRKGVVRKAARACDCGCQDGEDCACGLCPNLGASGLAWRQEEGHDGATLYRGETCVGAWYAQGFFRPYDARAKAWGPKGFPPVPPPAGVAAAQSVGPPPAVQAFAAPAFPLMGFGGGACAGGR